MSASNSDIRIALHMVTHGIVGDLSTRTSVILKIIKQYSLINSKNAVIVWEASLYPKQNASTLCSDSSFDRMVSSADVLQDNEIGPSSLLNTAAVKAFEANAEKAFRESPENVYGYVKAISEKEGLCNPAKTLLEDKITEWEPQLKTLCPAPTEADVRKAFADFVVKKGLSLE